jgi:DNA-binding PadR family transcriptional regulator
MCGMDIMEKVSAMANGRVQVGPGTLYNLLEQFADAGMIRETRAEGRRRSYILTDKGKEALTTEYARLQALARDYDRIFGTDIR